MWIVGPPNSHGMLVNMPKMGSTFITINSCGCNHVCHFQFWKKVTVKCEAYFFVLGCYMLQQMVLVTFRSATNYHYFLCCWPWHDELWGRLLLIFLDWKQELLKYHVPHVCVCVCVFIRFYNLKIQSASWNNLYYLQRDIFAVVPDNIQYIITLLLCTLTTNFDSWYQSTHVAFCTWYVILCH